MRSSQASLDLEQVLHSIEETIKPASKAIVIENSSDIYMADNDLGGLESSFSRVSNLTFTGNTNVGHLTILESGGVRITQNKFADILESFDRDRLTQIAHELRQVRKGLESNKKAIGIRSELLRSFFVELLAKAGAEFTMTVIALSIQGHPAQALVHL